MCAVPVTQHCPTDYLASLGPRLCTMCVILTRCVLCAHFPTLRMSGLTPRMPLCTSIVYILPTPPLSLPLSHAEIGPEVGKYYPLSTDLPPSPLSRRVYPLRMCIYTRLPLSKPLPHSPNVSINAKRGCRCSGNPSPTLAATLLAATLAAFALRVPCFQSAPAAVPMPPQ